MLCSFIFSSRRHRRARAAARLDEVRSALAPTRSFGGGRPAAERWREALADALAVVASELTLGATAVGCQYAIAARRRDA